MKSRHVENAFIDNLTTKIRGAAQYVIGTQTKRKSRVTLETKKMRRGILYRETRVNVRQIIRKCLQIHHERQIQSYRGENEFEMSEKKKELKRHYNLNVGITENYRVRTCGNLFRN